MVTAASSNIILEQLSHRRIKEPATAVDPPDSAAEHGLTASKPLKVL